jgi:hypothetical protein
MGSGDPGLVKKVGTKTSVTSVDLARRQGEIDSQTERNKRIKTNKRGGRGGKGRKREGGRKETIDVRGRGERKDE